MVPIIIINNTIAKSMPLKLDTNHITTFKENKQLTKIFNSNLKGRLVLRRNNVPTCNIVTKDF